MQGCCHGNPTPDAQLGIVYRDPRSRLLAIEHYRGTPLHPTPVYSIVWNVIVGLVLLRLWSLAPPVAFIAGLYLILAGIGRFAEEGFCGEPQTPRFFGLSIYQWGAMAAAIIGIVLTTIGTAPAGPLHLPSSACAALSLAAALVATFAMGIDFPHSSRRFARLTR